MTYMFILKCALKLVLKNILYYDTRSEKHQIVYSYNIRVLYMFQAVLCLSSGGQIICVQHVVSSLSMSDRGVRT